MKERPPSFLNGWSLKDILILAGILAGAIHSSNSQTDIAKDADDALAKGISHIDERMATIAEHQVGQDHILDGHEDRIRTLEYKAK